MPDGAILFAAGALAAVRNGAAADIAPPYEPDSGRVTSAKQ